MKRVVAPVLVLAFALAEVVSPRGQGVAPGVITGTATGTSGAPLPGVTVQVADGNGVIVGSTVTTGAGTFSIGGLAAGTFTVTVVGANGAVIGAASATLTAVSMTATVTVTATAGAVAAAASAAAASGLSIKAVAAAVGAAAAAVAAAAVVVVREDASPSR